MSDKPLRKLALVAVNWNTRELLSQLLGSIVAQSCGIDTEIVVVDNASQDGSVEHVRENFAHATIIRNTTNTGFARGCNTGIRQSNAQFVCLVNTDVIVLKNCLQELISYLEANPRVGMAGPQLLNAGGKVQRSCMSFPTLWNTLCSALAIDGLFPGVRFLSSYMMRFFNYKSILQVDVLNGAFWLFRRDALDDVGLLDEHFFMYGEDIDLCRRFGEKGWQVVFYPKAHAIHLEGRSAARDPIRFYLEMVRANLQYWKKHHGRNSLKWFWSIILLHQLLRLAAYSLVSAFFPSPKYDPDEKRKRSKACARWLLQGVKELEVPIRPGYYREQ